MYRVCHYSSDYKKQWDDFVAHANNATFLHRRSFLGYHGDRFVDSSLLVFDSKNKLAAIVPANQIGKDIYSHQGLSYGGVIVSPMLRFVEHVRIYKAILQFLNKSDIERFYLNPIPEIYKHHYDNSEELILHWLGAEKLKANIYSYIPKGVYSQPNQNRKRALSKANQYDVTVRESDDIDSFWKHILTPNLNSRFGVNPVHSIDEIELLIRKFPTSIVFFGGYIGKKLAAGVVLFITKNVVHFQYISSSNDKKYGVLEALFDHVLKIFNPTHDISFGTSSENMGKNINEGLLYWKQSFKSLNSIQSFYCVPTANYSKLDNRWV